MFKDNYIYVKTQSQSPEREAMGNAALLCFRMRQRAHGSPGGNHSLRGEGRRRRDPATPLYLHIKGRKNKWGLRAAVSVMRVRGGGGWRRRRAAKAGSHWPFIIDG